jgi:putative ABC transport system permease protein
MRTIRAWLLQILGAFGAGRSDPEIAEELQSHRDLLAAEYVRSGMTPEDARRRAIAEFGSLTSAAHAYRDQSRSPAIEGALRDGRMAGRSLARTPVMTISMIVVLGLGVGLSTAIAAVFHAIVWAGLPVAEPDAVMRVTQGFEGTLDRRVQGQVSNFSFPEFQTYRAATEVFDSMAAVSTERMTWRRDDGSRIIPAALVTGDYFRVLPVTPAAGRMLIESDARQPVVVISHRLWSRSFDAAPDVVGRAMWLDRSPYTIVGIAPPSFFGTEMDAVAMWLPLEAVEKARGGQATLADRNLSWLRLFGRLRLGATAVAAATEGGAISASLDRDYPGRRSTIAISRASRLDSGAVRNNRGPFVTVGVVAAAIQALLFLICGSNAAALLLARGAARQKEIAVRIALGAGRLHLVRQLAAEVVLVAIAGAAAGLVVCFGTLRALAGVVPIGELLLSLHPDPAVFGFALATGLAVAGLFGIAPARQALAVDCLAGLKGEAAFGGQVPALRLRRTLITVQVTVSLVLLIAAALLGRVVAQAWQANPGYDPRSVHVVMLDPNWQPGRAPAESGRMGADLAEAVASAAGIRFVGRATLAPFFGTGLSRAGVEPSGPFERLRFNQIDGHFFDALGVPLVAGRSFLAGEDDAVLVNSTLAAHYWGSLPSALGQTLFIPPAPGSDAASRPMHVVGVAPTLELTDVGTADAPTYYTRLTEAQAATASLVIGANAGVPVRDLVLDRLRAIDPAAFAVVTRVDERLIERTTPVRLGVAAAGLIGILALAIAAVGIHGVIAYTVAGRTREIGVRQALGARPAQVLAVVLGWTLRGVALGTSGALAAMIALGSAFGARLQGALNGVHPLDPIAFLIGSSVLAVAIAAAAYLPARRAVGLAPLAALRTD